MKTIFLSLIVASLFITKALSQFPPPSSTTNQGTEFWVAYGHHQYFESESINTQNMTIYVSVTDLPVGAAYATVTIEIDSSDLYHFNWFRRIYQIPANTVISIDDSASQQYLLSYAPSCAPPYGPIPKGSVNSVGCGDYRILDPLPANGGTGGERIFRNRGIHITSDFPVVAYAHIYGLANSGATMLIPYDSWGLHYTSINSRQANATAAYSFFYVIAANDNTPIKIIPSQPSRLGKPANVPIYVTLQKGQIYQYVGQVSSSGDGVQLTGSTVESLDSTKPVAVFSGCSRTEGEMTPNCQPSTRDNDMQQCFPQEIWGTDFLTSPFSKATSSSSITPSLFATTVYKIIARDSGTVVTINDTGITSLATDTFYRFYNNLPNKIHANHPIMIAQFMTSNNCSNVTDVGDPEMIYLSPTERGVKQTGFYRHTKEVIEVNYVSLIVPNDGLSTLMIDTLPYNSGTYSFTMPHPKDTGYTIVVKGWPSLRKQCLIKCDKRFTGITYGLGSVESYGYNVGANFYLNTPNVYPQTHPKIKGIIFCDMNNNGVMDATEYTRSNVKVALSNGNYTFSDINGFYELDADSLGAYTTTVFAPNLFTAVPQTSAYVFSTYDTVVITNIALQPTTLARDSVAINVVPAINAVSSHAYPYFIEYENIGSTNVNASAMLTYSNTLLAYDSCSDHSVVHSGNTITTGSGILKPGQRKTLMPYFTVKSSAAVGNNLKTFYSVSGNALQVKDSSAVSVQSMDIPMAEKATPAISPAQVAAGLYVEYTINFRNINTYTIRNLRITDTLSNLLRANTVEIVSTTHPCKVLVKGNTILFEFLDIYLSDATASKFKSFGYIKFKVRPKSSVVVGDIITNSATLYFDYDNAITPNIVTTIVNATGSLPVKLTRFDCVLKEKNKVLNIWETVTEVNVRYYNILRSVNGKDFAPVGKVNATGSRAYSFTDEHLPEVVSGNVLYYRLEIVDNDGSKTYSEIKSARLKPGTSNFVVFPNPTKGDASIEAFDVSQVLVFDYLGHKILEKNIVETQHSVTTLSGLSKGFYFVQTLSVAGEKSTQKLVVR